MTVAQRWGVGAVHEEPLNGHRVPIWEVGQFRGRVAVMGAHSRDALNATELHA